MSTRYEQLKSYAPSDIAVLDCEATGLHADKGDEILSLTIADGTGTILFDELICPERRKSWTKAQEISGISPEMVQGKKTLAERRDEICALLAKAQLLVGYNLSFDLAFLRAGGITLPEVPRFDVMKEFARVHGEYDPAHKDWKCVKLSECAEYYGYTFKPHSSAEDTKATAFCFRELLADPWFEKPRKKPMKAVDFQTGKEIWDYGDEEERLYISKAEKKKRAQKKQEADEEEPDELSEHDWLKPTKTKIVILLLAAVGFVIAGDPQGSLVCIFLLGFLFIPRNRDAAHGAAGTGKQQKGATKRRSRKR